MRFGFWLSLVWYLLFLSPCSGDDDRSADWTSRGNAGESDYWEGQNHAE